MCNFAGLYATLPVTVLFWKHVVGFLSEAIHELLDTELRHVPIGHYGSIVVHTIYPCGDEFA